MKKQNYITHNLSLYGIDLKRLERETYNLLFLGLIVAALFHGGLVLIFPAGETKVADKNSVQVELVKIPPRIIMPRPAIISRNTTHEIYRFRKKSGAAGVPSALRGMKNPYGIDYGDIKMEAVAPEISRGKSIDSLPESILVEEISLRMPKDKVPLKNDVFIDTGQFKSMVVFSSDNKMAVQGYTHLASICGKNFFPPDSMLYALKNLAGALNFFTNIKTDCNWRVRLAVEKTTTAQFTAETEDKPLELNNYPVIYISYDKPFALDYEERKNLSNYITSGGFIILDNPLPETSEGNVGKSLKKALIDALWELKETSNTVYKKLNDGQIKAITKYFPSRFIPGQFFKPLTENHELFHSFFDFNKGEPGGYWNDSHKKSIEGIYLDDRLIGLYTVGYGLSWNDKRNEEQLKMGVNMVVYALKLGKGQWDSNTGKMKNLSNGNIKVW